MRLLILFFLGLFSCKQQSSGNKRLINPNAKQLTDSAISVVNRSSDYKMAIKLLDQATSIDSNYFDAYSTKFAYQQILGQNNSSFITAKILNRLKPEDPQYYAAIGYLYFMQNDTTSAKDFYRKALIYYDKILDTMSVSTSGYKKFQMDKAFSLAIIGEKRKSNSLFKIIYDNQKDTTLKKMILTIMNEPREQFLKRLTPSK